MLGPPWAMKRFTSGMFEDGADVTLLAFFGNFVATVPEIVAVVSPTNAGVFHGMAPFQKCAGLGLNTHNPRTCRRAGGEKSTPVSGAGVESFKGTVVVD